MPVDPAPEFIPVTLDVGALQTFRRPFTPEAVKFKIQSVWKSGQGAMLVAYVDARLVIERLNHVTSIWEDRYSIVAPNVIGCDLTVCGITRRDVGVGQGPDDIRMKAAYSDALKRAAVKFGIGVSIYAMQVPSLKVGPGPDQLRTYGQGDNVRPTVDDRTMQWLREQYARWLESPRGRHFGEPLDHGDAIGAQGDPDTDVPSEAPAGPAEAPQGFVLGPAVEAALDDAGVAYNAAGVRWALKSKSDKETGRFEEPMLPAEFERLAREAARASSEQDITPLVELTARLEKMG